MGCRMAEGRERVEVSLLDPEDDKKWCEVFGCGRRSSGSYAIAPGTRIRLCRQCAEREQVLPEVANEPADFAGTRTARTNGQTREKPTIAVDLDRALVARKVLEVESALEAMAQADPR